MPSSQKKSHILKMFSPETRHVILTGLVKSLNDLYKRYCNDCNWELKRDFRCEYKQPTDDYPFQNYKLYIGLLGNDGRNTNNDVFKRLADALNNLDIISFANENEMTIVISRDSLLRSSLNQQIQHHLYAQIKDELNGYKNFGKYANNPNRYQLLYAEAERKANEEFNRNFLK